MHSPKDLSSLAARDFQHMRHYTRFRGGAAADALCAVIIGEEKLPLELALYQPDIPQNTGSLLRLGACLGIPVHIIHPTGFGFSDKSLRRAGMDYLEHAEIIEHTSFAVFEADRRARGRRLVLLTTKASQSAYTQSYGDDDILMVGRESAGVPEAVASDADLRVRIPMQPGLRSINVALAATLELGEAMRQTGQFATLV